VRERHFTRGGKTVSTKTASNATQLIAEGWQEVEPSFELPQPFDDDSRIETPPLPEDEAEHRRSEPVPGSPPAIVSRSQARRARATETPDTPTA